MKFATHSSLAFWHALQGSQRARTLALDRFVEFPLQRRDGRYITDREAKEYRRDSCDAVVAGAALCDGAPSWSRFLYDQLRVPAANLLYAQLQSRLMLNMASGVMENAGLCLDRFGLPYIPGSAVKGCARRMAIQQLVEAETTEAKTELLVQIALMFGWGDTDWKPGRKRKRHDGREIETEPYSDFWWAMAEYSGKHEADSQRMTAWQEVASAAAVRLFDQLDVRRRKRRDQPLVDLPNFAGVGSFLPAHPLDVSGIDLPLRPPRLGTLEPDVVTCHHPDYYRSDGTKPIATDDEDPNPVHFPAVAAGHVFAFAILPLRSCSKELLTRARRWLADGLTAFGIGAKTAAGYGWFDCSDELQNAVGQAIERREKQEAERRRKEAEAADQKASEQAERKRREE